MRNRKNKHQVCVTIHALDAHTSTNHGIERTGQKFWKNKKNESDAVWEFWIESNTLHVTMVGGKYTYESDVFFMNPHVALFTDIYENQFKLIITIASQ